MIIRNICNFSMKVVRSGDLVSYCAEEGVRILGEGKFLVSDSFPGNERTKYCLTSKVYFHYICICYFVSYCFVLLMMWSKKVAI
jgi:hypothetical protein